MQAALVIKTANGYAVVPYSGADVPAVSFDDLIVATGLGNSYSTSETVLDALREMFERPALREAA